IQERLTKNIADELFAQGVKGVVVLADAEHLCMRMRGVRNDATLTSSAYRGIFENKEEKESIMAMIRKRPSTSSF
ncbi:MAG: GTP cyclohydrolase I, partial [Nitrosopumilaceae archaeon]|nr:GTP cyclohydrolase I [Nitrosopumilaceae archaeon]